MTGESDSSRRSRLTRLDLLLTPTCYYKCSIPTRSELTGVARHRGTRRRPRAHRRPPRIFASLSLAGPRLIPHLSAILNLLLPRPISPLLTGEITLNRVPYSPTPIPTLPTAQLCGGTIRKSQAPQSPLSRISPRATGKKPLIPSLVRFQGRSQTDMKPTRMDMPKATRLTRRQPSSPSLQSR